MSGKLLQVHRGLVKIKLNQLDAVSVDLNKAAELGILEAYILVDKIRKRERLEQMIINL